LPNNPSPSYIVRPDYPAATRAPTVSDDPSAGCEPGSRWIWGARAWICISNAPGAAVWHEITAAGSVGPAGPQGPAGAAGAQGLTGLTGAQGAVGAAGPQGLAGATGAAGAQGAKGDPGAAGAAGPQGLKGDTGAAGAAGTPGLIGLTGPQGTQGATGAAGTAGLQGLQGIQGATGPAGPSGVSRSWLGPFVLLGSAILTTATQAKLGASGADAVPIPMPFAGTIVGVSLRTSADIGAAGVSLKAEVYKNGVATGIIATITGSAGSDLKATGTGSVAFSAGDELDIRVSRVGTLGTLNAYAEVLVTM
jgi:hypothetical protein